MPNNTPAYIIDLAKRARASMGAPTGLYPSMLGEDFREPVAVVLRAEEVPYEADWLPQRPPTGLDAGRVPARELVEKAEAAYKTAFNHTWHNLTAWVVLVVFVLNEIDPWRMADAPPVFPWRYVNFSKKNGSGYVPEEHRLRMMAAYRFDDPSILPEGYSADEWQIHPAPHFIDWDGFTGW